MVDDPLFWKAIYNTLYYTLLAVPIGVVVAMVLALAMNQRIREIAIYRAIFYLPSILPVFAISFIFIVMLNPGYGLVNHALSAVGLPVTQLAGRSGLHEARPGPDRPAGRRAVRADLPGQPQGHPDGALRVGVDRRRGRLPEVPQHHAAADDAGHPLRHRSSGCRWAPGLHSRVHPHRRRRAGCRPRQLAADVRVRHLPAGVPVRPDGLRGGALGRPLPRSASSSPSAVFRWARGWVYYEAENP